MTYIQKQRFTWTRKTTSLMGRVEATIELINLYDALQARKSIIGEDEVRRFTVRSLVDTGSQYLCINENIQEVLQLAKFSTKRLELANGKIVTCDYVGPVELRFKDIHTACYAVVLPVDSEPLLGLLPLEDMNVIIHPARNELIESPHLQRI